MLGPTLNRLMSWRTWTRIGLSRHGPHLLVLCYHDLRRDDEPMNWMRVSESMFRRQMLTLGEIGDFVDPDRLADLGTLPRNRLSVMITFDDGYANVARIALPILEKLGIPALVFISTDHMTSGDPFWFDLVTTPILTLGLEELDLTAFGLRHYSFRRTEGRGRWDDVEALLVDLKSVGNENDERVASVLAYFTKRFAGNLAEHRDSTRPMTRQEVETIAASPCGRIGSHGHQHRILTKMSDEQARASLAESRNILQDATDRPVNHVAYPNGDCNTRVRALAAAQGYEYGYITRGGTVTPQAPRLALPRALVGGFDGPDLRYLANRRMLMHMRPARR